MKIERCSFSQSCKKVLGGSATTIIVTGMCPLSGVNERSVGCLLSPQTDSVNSDGGWGEALLQSALPAGASRQMPAAGTHSAAVGLAPTLAPAPASALFAVAVKSRWMMRSAVSTIDSAVGHNVLINSCKRLRNQVINALC